MLYIYAICDRLTGDIKSYFLSHDFGLHYGGKYRTKDYFLALIGCEPQAFHKKNKGYLWYKKSKISEVFKG